MKHHEHVYIGGLFGGANNSSIYSSFANGKLRISDAVSSSMIMGGLIGLAAGTTKVVNSYVDDPMDMSAALIGGTGADDVGGLFGTSGGITNGYVSATVDGGADSDRVGGLRAGAVDATITSSYYDMGKVITTAADTERALGTAVSAAQLMGCTQGAPIDADSPPAGGCTTLYDGWSDAIWDFGDAGQLPALKYSPISEVAGDECSDTTGVDADELAANFRPNAIAQPYCGKLLPGQGR